MPHQFNTGSEGNKLRKKEPEDNSSSCNICCISEISIGTHSLPTQHIPFFWWSSRTRNLQWLVQNCVISFFITEQPHNVYVVIFLWGGVSKRRWNNLDLQKSLTAKAVTLGLWTISASTFKLHTESLELRFSQTKPMKHWSKNQTNQHCSLTPPHDQDHTEPGLLPWSRWLSFIWLCEMSKGIQRDNKSGKHQVRLGFPSSKCHMAETSTTIR